MYAKNYFGQQHLIPIEIKLISYLAVKICILTSRKIIFSQTQHLKGEKMKKLMLTLFILTTQLYAQNVNVSDYDVPISQAKTLRFDGSWNWSQTGDSVKFNLANGNITFRNFYSSLPMAWFINLDAVGGKNFDKYTHDIILDASFRKYIWEDQDWFALARINAEHANFYKQIASDLTVGFGFGRYINATALAKAVRIESHLLRDEVIKDYLPKVVMISIANIIERESEYKDIYGDTYETFWFDDIEEEIAKSGLLEGEHVGSIGILRMRQVLFAINERVNQRYYGWDLSAGILFPMTTFDKSSPGNPNLSLLGRFSFPVSWQTQINSIAEAFTPMDSSFFKNYTVRAGLDFIYELSNRINFVSGYRLGISKTSLKNAVVHHNLNASFWYYIENNIYLIVSAGFTKQGDDPRVLTTRVGLQYNLF